MIDPADIHYYQPGWTLVGAGVFERRDHGSEPWRRCCRRGVHWIKAAVAAFEPKSTTPSCCSRAAASCNIGRLIVCPGLKLDWHGVEGLVDTLGRNGVTSNYRYDLAPYTWELVRRA